MRYRCKVFQMSSTVADAPPVPAELAEELPGMTPRAAAVRLIARAQASTAEQPRDVVAEAEKVGRNVERFLDTPEGQARKAQLDRKRRLPPSRSPSCHARGAPSPGRPPW